MDYESKYKELVEAARAVVEGNPGLCEMNKRLGRVRDLLPEKESDDERIRKKLYHTVLGTPEDDRWFWDISKDKVLAYLEKQQPTNSEKPKEWTDADMREARQNLIVCCRDWERGENTTLLPIVATRARYFLEHLVEPQQPAEWSEDFEDNIRKLLHDKLTGRSEDGSMSWTTLIDDKTLKDIVNGIWFYVGKEALKYPNKELSQPEWSEEDEKYLNLAMNIVSSDFGEDSPTVSWLKSLRPQPHWKPSQKQMEELLNALTPGKDFDCGILAELYGQLKTIQ